MGECALGLRSLVCGCVCVWVTSARGRCCGTRHDRYVRNSNRRGARRERERERQRAREKHRLKDIQAHIKCVCVFVCMCVTATEITLRSERGPKRRLNETRGGFSISRGAIATIWKGQHCRIATHVRNRTVHFSYLAYMTQNVIKNFSWFRKKMKHKFPS